MYRPLIECHTRTAARSPGRPSGPAARVIAALRASSYGELRGLQCDFCEGMAILHGNVRWYYLKQIAQEIVRKVDGVEAVVNQIRVVPQARADTCESGLHKPHLSLGT